MFKIRALLAAVMALGLLVLSGAVAVTASAADNIILILTISRTPPVP